MLKAVKFGGSSVAGAAQFQRVREIVLSDPARRAVVASAAGKRFSGDHKLTDLLYLCHAHLTYGVSCEEILAEIEGRFVEIRDTLGLTMDVEGEFAALRARLDRSFPVDALVSRGEAFTSRLLAEYLGYTYVDAAEKNRRGHPPGGGGLWAHRHPRLLRQPAQRQAEGHVPGRQRYHRGAGGGGAGGGGL